MRERPYCTAILLAAGKGKRMGTTVSKQFLPICGKEILAWTVDVFENSPSVDEIFLVAHADGMDDVKQMQNAYLWKKVTRIVEGGKERQDSVYHGLRMLSEESDVVLIHDGVRPFVTETMISESIQAARQYGAAVIGVPVKDTIKICSADGMALETPERSSLWQILAPQTFRGEVIVSAYQQAKEAQFLGTDDASVAEFAGYSVKVQMGSYQNIKITTKEDLLIAEAFWKEELP